MRTALSHVDKDATMHRPNLRGLSRTSAAVLAVAAMVGLAACTANGGGSPSSGDSKTLTVVSGFDAAPNQLFGLSQWFAPVLEPLFRSDAKNDKPVPVLATSYTVNSDLTQIDITLRSGVTFHDGRALSPEDVVFSLEQAKKPENNSKAAAVAAKMTGVVAEGADKVRVTFSSPTSNMWDLFYQTYVVDPKTFSGIADGSDVNGTGPFVWTKWSPGKELILTKYAKYRDAKDVHYGKIDVAVITDPTAQSSAMRSGRAQLAIGMSTQDAAILAKDKKFTTHEIAAASIGLGLNTQAFPFTDKRVRQAVGYAVDRERLIQQGSAGLGAATNFFWGEDSPGWSKKLNTTYSYNPEKARQLVKEAGATGAEVPFIFPANPIFQSYFEIIAAGLTDAGLKPTAVPIENNEAVSRLLRGDLGPAYLFFDSTRTLAPATLMASSPIFATGEKSPQKFSDPKYDALRAAVEAAGPDNQEKAMTDLNEYLLDVAFNQPLAFFPMLGVSSDAVTVPADVPVFTSNGGITGLGLRPAK